MFMRIYERIVTFALFTTAASIFCTVVYIFVYLANSLTAALHLGIFIKGWILFSFLIVTGQVLVDFYKFRKHKRNQNDNL